MNTRGIIITFALLISCIAATGPAQQMPQDNWYVEGWWGGYGTNDGQFHPIGGIAVDKQGLVYITDTFNNDRIQVFQPDGKFLRKWGRHGVSPGELDSPCGIAIDADGLVYVVDRLNERIQVFQQDGTFVRKWGSFGSAPSQFSNPKFIAIDTNGLLYVLDADNYRIQVFRADGTFVRAWGSQGRAPGQLFHPAGIAIDSDNLVYVADADNSSDDRVQVFQPDGTFVRKWSANSVVCVAIGPDNLVYTDRGVYEKDGTLVRSAWKSSGGSLQFAFGSNGIVYYQDEYYKIWVMRRSYRNQPHIPNNSIPAPIILSVDQRLGTPYLDVDFKVVDLDNANVSVAALAFLSGSNTLSHLLKLNTLIEGTATNIGQAVPANQVNSLTWNAAADWSTNFGQVKIEILANDGRGMLDFHFLRIPSNGPNPELVIDRTPLTQTNLLSCWYWLIATNDPAILLTTGTVSGVNVPYTGKVLARGVNTTADGRAFLFERLGVREATSSEVARAKTAYTPGVTNQWTPRLQGDPRMKVNELGFDTYNYGTNAWFVVKP